MQQKVIIIMYLFVFVFLMCVVTWQHLCVLVWSGCFVLTETLLLLHVLYCCSLKQAVLSANHLNPVFCSCVCMCVCLYNFIYKEENNM